MSVPGSDPSVPVALSTRFDQFPATVKGAFVTRGADGNPHKVEFHSSRVDRIPHGPSKPVPLGAVQLNVAPGRDLYVPFEVGIADLEPGWYAIRSTIRVDAGRTWSFSSRGFAIPWPREAVRRGTLRGGGNVRVGGREVHIDGVEMRPDCAVLTWRAEELDPPARGPEVRIRLLAGGRELERVPADARPLGPRVESGTQDRAVFYPVPREATSLVVSVKAGTASESVELPLA